MNVNNFTYDELFKLAIEKPLMAQIEVTANCNQACLFCFRYCNPTTKFPDLSPEQWRKTIDKLTKIGVEEINFSGGEIFLYRDITELFQYAKSLGIKKITVNTNGQVDLSQFDLSNIDEFVFSIHGLGKTHDLIVNKKSAFDIIEKNLLYILKKFKGIVGINTVVCRENLNDLKKIYVRYEKMKIEYHAFNFNIDRNLAESENLKLDFKKYLKFLRTIPLERRKLRHGMGNILENNPKITPIQLPDCAAGKYKLIIDFKGDVFPCRYFQQDEYKCGNIFEQDLKNIWQSGKGFQFFRQQFLNKPKKCLECKKIIKCAGGCMAWHKKGFNERDFRCELGDAYSRN